MCQQRNSSWTWSDWSPVDGTPIFRFRWDFQEHTHVKGTEKKMHPLGRKSFEMSPGLQVSSALALSTLIYNLARGLSLGLQLQEEFKWGMKKCCCLLDMSCNYNLNIGACEKYKLTRPLGLERSLLSGNVLGLLKKKKKKKAIQIRATLRDQSQGVNFNTH